MFPHSLQRLRRPRPAGQLAAALGALLTLLLTGLLSRAVLGAAAHASWPFLIAPLAASAVLLFCLPAAPLAQPWPVIGGNVVSALVGVACAQAADPLLAAPLAGGLAIAAMAFLRCLHPPGGAVAVTAVLGGPAVHAAGFWFALAPVGLNSVLMVLGAVAWNRLSGHRYPHGQPAAAPPERKAGFAREDLDAALDTFGETLDVSRDDLAAILAETEQRAAERRARLYQSGELARPVPAILQPDLPLAAARALLVRHGVPALPVVDAEGRPVGVLSTTALLFGRDTFETVGRLVEPDFVAVRAAEPVTALLARFHEGAREVFVVDAEGRLAGMVQPGDLLAGLELGVQEPAA